MRQIVEEEDIPDPKLEVLPTLENGEIIIRFNQDMLGPADFNSVDPNLYKVVFTISMISVTDLSEIYADEADVVGAETLSPTRMLRAAYNSLDCDLWNC